MRKKLNREPRERTRKEDEEFEQRKGGRARRLAGLTFLPNGDVNRAGRGKAISSENFVISVPFVVKNLFPPA